MQMCVVGDNDLEKQDLPTLLHIIFSFHGRSYFLLRSSVESS